MDNATKTTARNPFDITRAADFSDQQIGDYWVDLTGEGNRFLDMAKPTSEMPMLILGGKGSGKTHLMRYFSYQLQKIRSGDKIIEGIQKDGFLGIYFRCGGLNSSRFSGKKIAEDTWSDVFSYYMELWLAELVLSLIGDIFKENPDLKSSEKQICNDILKLFDDPKVACPENLVELTALLKSLQRKVNTAVNNSSISRRLDLRILVTPGTLTFGVPKCVVSNVPAMKAVQFLYLVDEFENLSEPQQKYINTLYRERQSPCSFKIGARLFGVRTYHTLSANEENKAGSEYDIVYLDDYFRKLASYPEFAKDLCVRRLMEAGYPASEMNSFFESFPESKLAEQLLKHAVGTRPSHQRPYFKKLRDSLATGLRKGVAYGVQSDEDIDTIIANLSFPDQPLLEKVNSFLFYKAWYSKKDLLEASESIKQECLEFIQKPGPKNRLQLALNYFKSDLIAQVLRECKQRHFYLGFEKFVEMSDGLPRNLLIILKHIYKWAVFNNEQAFTHGNVISKESQWKGVREGSDWFYDDAVSTGENGELVRASINRLAELFRDIRFSDKPSECSICTFSVDESSISKTARELIKAAENWSLLVDIESGQRDRNSNRVDAKYQINRMLAPRWDLPISRRGAVSLNAEEANSVFDPADAGKFEQLSGDRIDRMTAPFFGKNAKKEPAQESNSATHLPGFDHD
jgi:hypothetical protein